MNYIRYLIISTIVFSIAFFSELIAYIIVENTFDVPEEWIINLQEKCGSPPENKTLHYKSLVFSGLVTMGYGSYIGILVHKHYHGHMWPGMFKTHIVKVILRYLVIIVMTSPFGACFLFIKWETDIVILLIFKTFLPLFGMSFVMFAFSHYFYAKFNLLNSNGRSNLKVANHSI